MELYNLRIGKIRYKNISIIEAAAVIARRGHYIKENYNIDPDHVLIDLIYHRNADRVAWYDDGKVVLSINKRGN